MENVLKTDPESPKTKSRFTSNSNEEVEEEKKQPAVKTQVKKVLNSGDKTDEIAAEKNREVLKHFLTSLQKQPEEYDLDFVDEVEDEEQANNNSNNAAYNIEGLWKLEKFSPQLNAHMMLVNTGDARLFVIGVLRTPPVAPPNEEEQEDLDDEIIEHEIKFDRQTMIAHVCELKEYLILSTKSDNRIVIVNKQFQVAKIIASRIQIASLSLVGQTSKFLFAATDTGTLKCYEANKLLSKTPTSVDFYTPEQDV